MQVFSKDQAKYIDDVTIKSGKLTSIELMKNAGIKISGFLQKKYPNKKFVFVCGKGNNGGDGFAAALDLKIKNPIVISKIVIAGIRAINLFSIVLFAAKTFKP